MKKLIERYSHIFPALGYFLIYATWFGILEKKVTRPANLIHMKIDDSIPFCEYFIVPYLLWFFYIGLTFVYFIFRDKEGYIRLCLYLFTGMTVFLLVSTIWPNGHNLRPRIMPRDNLFTALTQMLYQTDTPTNLWPSIHVFNSIGAHIAIARNDVLRKQKPIILGSLLLCISIILSTVFLKQHSVFDVLTAFLMAAILYVPVYTLDLVQILRNAHDARIARKNSCRHSV